MQLRRVATKEELDSLWSVLLPKFKDSANHSYYSMNPDDIKALAEKGECEIFYLLDRKTGDITLALAAQFQDTEHGLLYFILALGGEGLDAFLNNQFNDMCTWMRLNGATAIEGAVRPGMSRVLDRHKWKPVNILSRFEL